MAKKRLLSAVPVMEVVYRTIDKTSLYVGRKYYLKLETMRKYVPQEIRDRILINHRKGLHVGETVEEYSAYRDEMDLWCDKGRLYDKFTEAVVNDNPEDSKIIATTAMVSINSGNNPQMLFETDETRDAMCLKTFML